MAEARKSYYTIAEAARLLGAGEEELWRKVREGAVPSKRIGMRLMVPAAGVFGEAAEAGRPETANKGERYLERIRPDLLKALEGAPEYGYCGITITFHAGQIHKISSHSDVIRLEGKEKPWPET
jgi:hypothetical protein